MSVTIVALAALSACGEPPETEPNQTAQPSSTVYAPLRETSHRGADDLLSAGLGLKGLRGPAPPLDVAELSDPKALRRLAMHSNWQGLADLTATGGFEPGDELPRVPGREFQALVQLRDRDQPVRMLLQLPDAFDADQPCLLVAPVSGSRGIYGGVPVAGPWGLTRGCAVAYTDKGGGTDYFYHAPGEHAASTGVTLDGTRAPATAALAFEPGPAPAPLVSVPHAHSGDHPEADWGAHTIEAARFGLAMLERVFPEAGLGPDDVDIIGVAISNGGGAVLRALEQDTEDLFDAAVVAAPNVTPPGARHLYDYATEAALYQPCLLAEPDMLAQLPLGNPALLPAARQRCETLHQAGLIDAPSAAAARTVLAADGFDAAALEQAAVNTALDLWRSVAALYASAYARTPVDAMPCRYGVAVVDADGNPVPASEAQRRAWWAVTSGVVPGGGVGWIDPLAARNAEDPAFPALQCLRDLWTAETEAAESIRRAVGATTATAELPDLPVLIIHGRQDGLIPAAFSSRPYVQAARDNGAGRLAYWEIDGAQHFDAIVPMPGVSERYRPLLPYLWQGLDRIEQVLAGRGVIGEDQVITAVARD